MSIRIGFAFFRANGGATRRMLWERKAKEVALLVRVEEERFDYATFND